MSETPIDWSELRKPFEECDISWLPKPTKAQTDAVKANFREGQRCEVCGGWHHPQVVHLPYVGHAAVTNRLLNFDPEWSWDFLYTNDDGSPVVDQCGGMWITLAVKGVTRKGYGEGPVKNGADGTKERIGDAIRNAAMRFGVALELWHKGEMSKAPQDEVAQEEKPTLPSISDTRLESAIVKINSGEYTKERLLVSFLLTDEQQDKIGDLP